MQKIICDLCRTEIVDGTFPGRFMRLKRVFNNQAKQFMPAPEEMDVCENCTKKISEVVDRIKSESNPVTITDVLGKK